MKKIISVMALVLGLATMAYAANDASSGAFSFGFSFPQIYNMNTAGKDIDSEKYSCFGINFALRGAIGLPFGLYLDGNLYFPHAHKITMDDTEYNYDMSNNKCWGIEGQIGIYSVLLNSGRFLLPFGGGLHLNYAKSEVNGNPDITQGTFSLGVGGWMNAEFQLTEKVTLYAGLRLDYDFWQRMSVNTKVGTNASKTSTNSGAVSNLFLIPVVGMVIRF